jgi:predicted nicotinamide N-methyase
MRTTLDIEQPVLADLRRLARKRRRSMSRLASDLLADALNRVDASPPPPSFSWNSRNMDARVDIDDKDALHSLLDADRECK